MQHGDRAEADIEQGSASKPVSLVPPTEAQTPRRRGRPNIHEDVPVSLAPLDFETALAGLLQVSPEPEKRPTAKKQPAKKRASKKR